VSGEIEKKASPGAVAPVLLVGAGAVGLCLAMDLARRGIHSTVLERRAAGELPSVKCNHVSARTPADHRAGVALRNEPCAGPHPPANHGPAGTEDASPAGEAARRALGEASYALHVQQFVCEGLNFGYFYDDSPIIAYDGEPAPAYTTHTHTPSTAPGCRVPHLRLRDGRPLMDALGPWYTLLRLDRAADAAPLLEAATRAGMPLSLLDVDAQEVPAAYALLVCAHHRQDHEYPCYGGRVQERTRTELLQHQ
jgi:glycine/D-amino acid oxidase-like deaminating enzyme